MTDNKWGFPLLIIGVLLVTSLLTVVFPSITRGISQTLSGGGGVAGAAPVEIPDAPVYQENVEIKVEGYLLGEELVKIPALGEFNSQTDAERTYTSLSLLAVITAIVIGGMVAFTIPIALLGWLGSRGVNRTLNDESYEAANSGLKNKLSAKFKEENKEKPVTGKPETHYRPMRDGWAAGFMIVFLAYFLGYVLGEGVSSGSGRFVANIFFVLAAIGSYFYFRPARMEAIDNEEYGTYNRGLIWVFLSGAIVMGLGVGLMYVVISGGDPFPWLEWTPGPRIDWEMLRQWLDDSGLRFSDWN